MDWQYSGDDAGIMLFTAAQQAWGIDIKPHQRVLEIGCNENNFLNMLKAAEPTLELYGVDWRPRDLDREDEPQGWTFIQGNAWDETLFPADHFDWVISLGAFEHFGLGFYGDPVDSRGDFATLCAIADWLKPGGRCYFDVPCNPEYSQTRHYRVYEAGDGDDSVSRLMRGVRKHHGLIELARGYSLPEPNAGTWVPQPMIAKTPYHYVAILAEKS